MNFQDFIDSFNPDDLSVLSPEEQILYSRQDLKQKENIAELIFYPDSMIDNWENLIEQALEVPFVYIIHDKDNCKVHGHLLISWSNNVQLSYFLKFFNNLLSRDGCVASKLIKAVKNVQGAYDYLIHDTPKARSDGKYQYSPLSRHCCNGFDIHFVAQVDKKRKMIISKDIASHIKNYNIMDLMQLYDWILTKNEDYYDYYESHSGYLDRLCAGNWKNYERNKAKQKQ